jgi:hypothetical protein
VKQYRHEHASEEPPLTPTERIQFAEVAARTAGTPDGERVPEKSRCVLRPGSPVAEKYEFIDSCRTCDAKDNYPVKKMCAWLAIFSSGFFDWKKRPVSLTAE